MCAWREKINNGENIYQPPSPAPSTFSPLLPYPSNLTFIWIQQVIGSKSEWVSSFLSALERKLKSHWISLIGPAWDMKGLTEPELKLVFPPWEKQINNKKKYPKPLLVFRAHSFWLFFFPVLCRLQALSSQNATTTQSSKQVWDLPWVGVGVGYLLERPSRWTVPVFLFGASHQI